MAKKKDKLNLDDKLDDFDFGDDDFGDLLFDEDEDRSKSRKPEGLSRVADSFKNNMLNLDTYKDPEELKRLARKALPKELNSEVSDFKGVFDSVNETISKETSEIKKQVTDLAGNMNKLLPTEGKLRSLFDKTLGKILPSLDTEYERRRSEEEERTEAINNSIAAAIGDNAKLEEIRNATNQALEDRRTASTNTLLKDVVENTRISKELDIQITAKFQKKSLELQYRQVYILKDILENARTAALKQDSQLQAIVQNTSLPDILKARQTELYKAETLKRFRDGATKALFKDSNVISLIQKGLNNRIKNFTENIKDNLSQLVDVSGNLVDGREMMESMGISKSDMLGSSIAEGLRDNIVNRAFKKVYGTNIGKKFIQTGKLLHHDPSSFFRNQITNENENTGFFAKAKNKIFTTLADLTNVHYATDGADIRKEDLDSVSSFDGRTKLSINTIIPAYLRKIHSEVYSVRMGIKDQDVSKYELVYDVNRESFTTRGSIQKNLKQRARDLIVGSTKYDRDYISSVFRENGIDETLSRKVSKKALEASVNTNKNGIYLFKEKSFLKSFSEEEQKKIQQAISKIEQNPNAMDNILYSTSSMRGNLSSFNPVIEELAKSGYSKDLAKIGLLKYNKSTQSYNVNNREVTKFFLNSYVEGSNGLSTSFSREDFDKELRRIKNLSNRYEKERAIKELYTKYKDYFDNNPDELKRFNTLSTRDLKTKDIKEILASKYNSIRNMSKEDYINLAKSTKDKIFNIGNKTLNKIESSNAYNKVTDTLNAVNEETDKIIITKKLKDKARNFISMFTNKEEREQLLSTAKDKIEKAYKDVKDPEERSKLINKAKEDFLYAVDTVKSPEGRKEILNNIEVRAQQTKAFLKEKTKEIKNDLNNDPYLQEKLANVKENEKVKYLYNKASGLIEKTESVKILKDKIDDVKKSETYAKAKKNLDIAIEYSKSILNAADMGDIKTINQIVNSVKEIAPEAAETDVFKETVSNAKELIKAKKAILVNQEKELALQTLASDQPPEEKKKGLISFLARIAKMGFNLLPIGATAKLIGKGMWAFTKFGWKTEWKIYSGLVRKILNLGRLALPRTVRQALSLILPKKYRAKFIGTKDQSYVGYAKSLAKGMYNVGKFGYKVGKFGFNLGVKYPILGLSALSTSTANMLGNVLFGKSGTTEEQIENNEIHNESLAEHMLSKASNIKNTMADKAKSIFKRNKEKKLEESLTANNKEARRKKLASKEKIINGKKVSEINKGKDKDKKEGGGLLTTVLGSLLGVLGTLGTAAGHLVKFFIGGGLTSLFKTIGGMLSSALGATGGLAKAGSWVMEKAGNAVKGIKNAIGSTSSKISEYLGKLKGVKGVVKEKIIKRVGAKRGASLAGRLIGKIAGRLLPGIGTALLLYDISCIGYYMAKGMDFKSAACKAILGFDPWNEEEPMLDENGRPIKPDEEEPVVTENTSSKDDEITNNYISETGNVLTEEVSSDKTVSNSIMKSTDSSNVVLDTSRLETLHYEALKIHSNILKESKETNNKLDSIIKILSNTHEEVKTNTRISVEKMNDKKAEVKQTNGKSILQNQSSSTTEKKNTTVSYDEIPAPIIDISRKQYGNKK